MSPKPDKVLLSLGLIGLLACTDTARAAKQLDELMGNSAFKATLGVACGSLEKSNCAQVLPRIAAQAAPKGLTLEAIASKGSIQSAEGVCKGVVQGALGQRDAFDQVKRQTECVSAFERVGKPIYPYYGYFVAPAHSPYDSVRDWVKHTAEGKIITVAVGKEGSGGQITLGNILKNVPEFKRVLQMKDQDPTTALDAIKNGSLDALFVMDGPGSELIDEIRKTLGKENKPLFKFLTLDLDDAFYKNVQGWDKKPLYYQANIVAPGWFSAFVYPHLSTNCII
jgi:TRAP-type uncharacterized transport system substrate-binding protein